MARLFKKLKGRPLTWFVIVLGLLCGVALAQAALPGISLNSPASFPVDI